MTILTLNLIPLVNMIFDHSESTGITAKQEKDFKNQKVGNQNNRHDINSLSANADATLRRRVAYLVIAKFFGCFCFWVGNQKGRQPK
ncbi:MAG: hypothetical protein LBU34_15310 [Planctomycetaceae bacterium]|nr:hypothetical protein [Planctomycetaceae bacterium]